MYSLFTASYPDLTANEISQGQRPPFEFTNVPFYVCNLIESCWLDDANKRPSFEAILYDLDTLDPMYLGLSDANECRRFNVYRDSMKDACK